MPVAAAAAPLVTQLAPAFVTAGAGLVDSVINAFSTSSANERNIELAREQMAWQSAESEKARQASRDFALEMFDLENAYNTPLAQIERLREAGINPYVALSQGSSQISGQASGNASLPGLMPGGVAMPHVSPIPSPVSGFLPALQAFAEIKLKDAQARKAGAETHAINEKLQDEIDNLMADTRYKEAQASYTQLLRDIESVYGRSERSMKLKNMAAEFSLALAKGETEKAQKLYYDAEKELTDTKNANEKQQAPIILENLKKTGRAIDASAAASRASADESRAGAAVKWKEADIREIDRRMLEAQEGDIIFARRLENAKNFRELGEMVVTFEYRLESLRKANLISEQQLQEAKSKARMAEKENDWYHWNQFLHTLETINNGVTAYIPLTSERTTTKKSGYDYIRGDYDENISVTHSKRFPWQK